MTWYKIRPCILIVGVCTVEVCVAGENVEKSSLSCILCGSLAASSKVKVYLLLFPVLFGTSPNIIHISHTIQLNVIH